MKYIILCFSIIYLLSSCNSDLFREVPNEQFIGKWMLSNRGILDGLEIEIYKNDKGKLKGEVLNLNDNKYVQLFMEVGDKFIKDIDRYSHTEFDLTEKKIAAPLFSIYGESTSNKVQVHFHHKDTIYIGEKGNKGKYIRVK